MTIQLNATEYPLPVSKHFIKMLMQRLKNTEIPKDINRITVKFSDPNYGKKPGGFHPTDIQLKKQTDSTWCITTICDYCNVSHTQYPHFAIDLTFDFINKLYHNIGTVFSDEKASEHYQEWQANFVYFIQDCGVYDTDIQIFWTKHKITTTFIAN